MPRMRLVKAAIEDLLTSATWRQRVDEIVQLGIAGINALFAFLPREPRIMHRAALCMGISVGNLVDHEMESVRNIIRRLIWHMNEDSGNIGWGIPEAFGEILAADESLAKQYSHILISYIIELPSPDNYCDNSILRRSCYWSIGRLAEVHPELIARARPWLAGGLNDEDIICRGMAAWALSRLMPDVTVIPALRTLVSAEHSEICLLFDGKDIFERSVSELARDSLERALVDE